METKRYLPEGISREIRTKKLNEHMRGTKPGVCIERARLVTEAYRQTEGEPFVIRRAKALSYILENMTLFINEDELIAGNHASKQRWAPMYPETGAFSRKELDLFPVREVDTLSITEEDKAYLLHEVYPYWKDKNTGDISQHYFSDDILELLNTEHKIFDPISRTRSGYGHYIPNIQNIIRNGFVSVEEKALEYMKNLSTLDTAQRDKYLFYKAVLIVCEGVKRFAQRYSELAAGMALTEKDPRRKKELGLIAAACSIVPYLPAENYHQALQAYWFTILIDYIAQNGSAISAGRFDQYIYPYYKSDIGKGILVQEEAQELLEALWVKHSDIIKAGTYNSARNNGGFATTVHLNLSGMDRSGNDATNEFSYLCLEAEKNVFNSEPNVGIRVNTKTPDDFIYKVLEILVQKEGGKLPLYNDDAIVQALYNDGVPLELARDYGIVGCVEPTPSGNTMGITNASYFNLAKCLEITLNDGLCMLTGKRLGLSTGDPKKFKNFDDIMKAYVQQIHYLTGLMVKTLNTIESVIAQYTPHVYSSMLIDGCMESGLDATRGGAQFNYIGVQGVGLADAADSLAAVKRLVFDEKKISMDELLCALKSNFNDNEVLRQILINRAPKYGNDIDEVDDLAHYIADVYCGAVKKGRDFRGGTYRPGLFCLSSNVSMGRDTAALPSGRLASTPLADGGISPKHGMDTSGPTAAAKSAAKLDHLQAVNGVNFNQKYFPDILKTFGNRKRLVELIRTYFKLKGFHIQFNILSAETLRKAQYNPEAYRSCVVRVAGYSAFFVDLDRDIQDEIIERTEQHII